ncbi:MAG TPA: aromatic ring-hydroxylating dioxygenase subunit alpha, partial [Pirellulaceae bacterium]|nr:aromatic ring-hydroxylating dioxygenase subunit alpha [Pirellulaceae bacterium]
RSAAGAMTLRREYYVDQEILHSERRSVMANHWCLLGHVSDVSQARSFFTTELAGGPVLILRDDAGQIQGFHNVCRHRGAMLEERTCGQWEREAILCPYHGWTYELCGRLAGAPNMHDVESFDRTQWGLKPISVREWQGWILGCVGSPTAEQQVALNLLSDRLAPWRCERLVRAARLEYDVAANWKIIFENYSECYHCPLVHPSLNRLTPYIESENFFHEGCVLGGPMALAEGVATMSMTGRAIASPMSGLSEEHCRHVYYFTLFPSGFISLHPDYVMVHRLLARNVDRTQVTCEFYVEPDALNHPDFDPSSSIEFWDVTNRQDWHVCELVQRGAQSAAFAPGPMSNLESVVAAFDRYYLSALTSRD